MNYKMRALQAFELVYIKRVLDLVEGLGGNAGNLKELGKLARKLSAIEVHACNGTKFSGENGEKEHRDAEEKVYLQIFKICKPIGLHWYHQTDPRGAQLYIASKELGAHNYNTEGYAVDQF